MSRGLLSIFCDYAIFFIFLILTTIYPLWNDMLGREGKRTKANYVFATGRVSMLPMMFSIARGILGVRALLGYSSELFYRGAEMFETLYGFVAAYPVVCFIFVPVYCNLGITSVYQYLDLRFKSKLVKRIASISFIIRNVLSMGINIYAPSVALNTIAGIPYWVSLTVMTGISIFFTFMGGLKAAITADAIQGTVLILVTIAIAMQGTYETGNVKDVYNINKENGRLEFFRFTGDITTRVDTLSAFIGQLIIYVCVLGCEQNLVQRYLSMKTVKDIRKTLLANIPLNILLFPIPWLAGMAIYSTYFQCDPLQAGYIKKFDGITPFFVNDKLTYIPGFMGLFLATLFNGALCVNVSNLNSLATCTYEDFISRLHRFKQSEDKMQLKTIKYLAVGYAILTMIIAFCTGLLPGVIESAILAGSATSGPLVGVFLLAMLVPAANGRGAAIGMLTSHMITLIIICGSFTIVKSPAVVLPTSVEGCTNQTFSPWIDKFDYLQSTLQMHTNMQSNECTDNVLKCMKPEQRIDERSIWQKIFGMSFMYYGLIGTLVTIIVGIVFSWITKNYEQNEYDERLLHPIIRRFLHKKMENANDANTEYFKVKNNSSLYIISNDSENLDIYRQNVNNELHSPNYRKTDNI